MVQPPRRFLRVLPSLLGFVLSRALVFALLAATALLWRLSSGPLSTPFLAPAAARLVEDVLPGWRVEVEGVAVDLSGGVGVSLRNVRLFAPSGALALEADQAWARARFSDSGALFSEAALTKSRAYLTRDAAGRLALGVGAAPDLNGDFAALIETMRQGGSGGPSVPLRRLAIENAEVTIDDLLTGRVWRAAGAHVLMDHPNVGMMLSGRADLRDARGEHWPLRFFVRPQGRGGNNTALVHMNDVNPVILAQTIRSAGLPLEPLARLRARASARLRTLFTSDWELQTLDVEINAGPGVVALDRPRALERAELIVSYARATQNVTIKRAMIAADRLHVEASGAARLTRGADGNITRVYGQVSAPSAAVGGAADAPDMRLSGAEATFSADLGPRGRATADLSLDALEAMVPSAGDAQDPIILSASNLTASLEGALDGGRVRLTRATAAQAQAQIDGFTLPITDLSASAEATRAADADMTARATLAARAAGATIAARFDGRAARGGVEGSAHVSAPMLNVAQLLRLWPDAAAPKARKWVSERLTSADLSDIEVFVSGAANNPDRTSVSVTAHFENAEMIAHPQLPPVVNLSGDFSLTERALRAQARTGRISAQTASGPQALDVSGTMFRISDLRARPAIGEISLSARGSAPAALALMSGPPLRVTERTRIDPETTSGTVAATGRVTLPLVAGVPKDQVRVDVTAELTDYALTVPGLDLPASGPQARVRVAPGGVQVTGQGRLAGAPTTFDLRRPSGEDRAVSIRAETIANAALRARFKLPDAAAPDVDPPVRARVDLRPDGATVFEATADLSGAALALAPLGWRKPPGAAATLTARGAALADKSVQISSLVFAADTARIEASARIDSAGRVAEVLVPAARVGAGLDLSAFYDGDILRVEGDSLDLTAAVERARDSEARGGPRGAPRDCPQELRVRARIDRVFLTPETTLERFNGGVIAQPCGLLGLDVGFHVNGRAPARLRARRQADGYGLEVDSPDAGALLRAFDLYRGVRGGRLALRARARLDVAPVLIQGAIQVDDFVLTQAPMAARVLARGSLIGMLDELESGGLTFARLQAPFVGDGTRWRFAEAAVYGPSLGVALEGTYDARRKTVNLIGSLSPAFAINGALSQAPILGDVITGGAGGGVFGVSFAVNGPTRAPQITVNPIASLAPGVFRRMLQNLMR